MPNATWHFFYEALGGIAIGLAVGYVVVWIRPRLKDHSIEEMVSLLTPYFAYLPTERLGMSSVLATVACGLFVARRLSHIASPDVRIRGYAIWDAITFLLNGLAFILIGFALPETLEGIGDIPTRDLVRYAVLISLAAIVVRLLWVFPFTYLPRPSFGEAPEKRSGSAVWVGFHHRVDGNVRNRLAGRGIALPRTLPNQHLILFLTFGVILATLVLQGLSLPFVIKLFNVKDTGQDERDEKSPPAISPRWRRSSGSICSPRSSTPRLRLSTACGSSTTHLAITAIVWPIRFKISAASVTPTKR